MLIDSDHVFDRVQVDHLAPMFTRVAWDYHPNFVDPGPYETQLQMGYTGSNDSDDWRDVGSPATNAFSAVDSVRKQPSKEWDLHYRVKLTTEVGEYLSPPVATYGVLNRAEWLKASEIVRQRLLVHTKFTGWPGLLLKRRRRGTTPTPTDPDVRVTNFLTEGIETTKTTPTAGTEYTGGYFAPVPVHMALTNTKHDVKVSDDQAGTTDMVVQGAEVVAFPMIHAEDVFVHQGSGRRFLVRPTQTIAEHVGVPLILMIELRQLPRTHPVFDVEVDL